MQAREVLTVYLDLLILLLVVAVLLQRRVSQLTLKQLEKKMSELSDAVAEIGKNVGELQAASQRVIDLLTQPNPDVSAAIAALQNADAGFDAVTAALNAAGTIPEPEPEPEG